MNGNKKKFIRERLLTLGNNLKCAYCLKTLNRETYTLDHIIPLFKGGTHHTDNLAPSCQPCNIKKGYALNWKPKFTVMQLGVLDREMMNEFHRNDRKKTIWQRARKFLKKFANLNGV